MALPQDERNYWMLPQNPEEGGYYKAVSNLKCNT